MFDTEGESSAELFELLTDALRAGPGSASWSAAVRRISVSDGVDEYGSLLTARQRLEEGRGFRSVVGSERLRQAVIGGIAAAARAEQSGVNGKSHTRWPRLAAPGPKTLVAVAAVAAMLILAVGTIVISMVLNQGGGWSRTVINLPPSAAQPVLGGFQSFDSALPASWRAIGALRVKTDHGLRLAGGMKQVGQSGGVLRVDPLPMGQPYRLEAAVRYVGGTSVSPQIFLTDDKDVDDDRPAEKNHELLWTVMDDHPRLRLPDQTLATPVGVSEAIAPGQSVTMAVTFRVNGSMVVVETTGAGKKSCWTVPHLLAADKAWHVGVRLMVNGARRDDCVAVESVRLVHR